VSTASLGLRSSAKKSLRCCTSSLQTETLRNPSATIQKSQQQSSTAEQLFTSFNCRVYTPHPTLTFHLCMYLLFDRRHTVTPCRVGYTACLGHGAGSERGNIWSENLLPSLQEAATRFSPFEWAIANEAGPHPTSQVQIPFPWGDGIVGARSRLVLLGRPPD